MSKKIEIERRFLVEFPKSWSDLAELFDDLVDVKRIFQTYLEADSDNISPRVRKTIQGLTGDRETVYDYNKKHPAGVGANHEKEFEISKSQFEDKLKQKRKDKETVVKTRFVFKYDSFVFELDVFKGALRGLAILEIELDDLNEKFKLPPFLKIIKEVTENKKFNNFHLASIKSPEELKKLLNE